MEIVFWVIIGVLLFALLYLLFEFIDGRKDPTNEVEQCPKCGYTYYKPVEYYHDELECWENMSDGRR